MKRLKSININFPNLTDRDKESNRFFFDLFSQLENIKRETGDTLVSKLSKEKLYPEITFQKAEVNSPQISFLLEGFANKSWKAGNLIIGFNLISSPEITKRKIKDYKLLRDEVGEYVEIAQKGRKYYLLTLKYLHERIGGKLLELNHAGVNLGPKILSEQDYLLMKNKLAESCNLYAYPTGEEWPFIIPSTNGEFLKDIEDETLNRNPKFELVYYDYQLEPEIQLDIETKLTKKELLEILPEPYGISFEGLEDYFRTVFVLTDWDGVALRFDLRFKSEGKDFGYWIIQEGGRINKQTINGLSKKT